MNIGIIGYGKMGKMIEQAALARGHRIAPVIDPYAPEERAASGAAVFRAFPGAGKASAGAAIPAGCAAEVYIEFTRPDTAPENIKAVTAAGTPVVSGSTGWYDRLPEVAGAVEASGSALLWASNFSLGVNLFYRIASQAARLFDPFGEYDVGGLEVHHNKKADSPSGTAKTLMEKVLAAMKRKTRVIWDTPGSAAGDADAVHFASLRHGAVPGVHSLFFDSPADTIEITHTARNREGFALGAIIAAEWLLRAGPETAAAGVEARRAGSPPRRGVFTMDDVLQELL